MGMLIDGQWTREGLEARNEQGRYRRRDTAFRNWVTADGAPGPRGEGGFSAEPGRYHLYISWACPWAHRTMIMRALKGLETAVSASATHWLMGDDGWSFAPADGLADPLGGASLLYQVYQRAYPRYTGRVTVPALWDRQQGTIVSNESSEIIRMFNSAFDGCGALAGDYYPSDLRADIDAVNARVYETLNNGVYRCGFATTQDAYDEAIGPLFDTLTGWRSALRAGATCSATG